MRFLPSAILCFFLFLSVACGSNTEGDVVRISRVEPENIAELDFDSVSAYNHPLEEMPDPNTKLSVRRLGRLDIIDFDEINEIIGINYSLLTLDSLSY